MSGADILDSAKFAWTVMAVLAALDLLAAARAGQALPLFGAVLLLVVAVYCRARLPADPPAPNTGAAPE